MQKGIQKENRAFLACLGGQRPELGQTEGPGLFLDNGWVLSLLSVSSLSGLPRAVFYGGGELRITGIFCAGPMEEDSSRAAHPLLFCTWKNTRN